MEDSTVPKKVIYYHGAFVHFITPEEATAQPQDQSRTSASLKKLASFSETHLIELSADMYDELERRTNPEKQGLGHLEPRSDIHWKRNDARKHVGSLHENRFREICRDLVTEHERRYSELFTGPTYPLQDSMPMSDLISRLSQRTFDDKSSGYTVNFPSQSSSSSSTSRLHVNTDHVVIQSVNESNVTPTKVLIIESDSEYSDEESEHEDSVPDSVLNGFGSSSSDTRKSNTSTHREFDTEKLRVNSGAEVPLTPVKDAEYPLSPPPSVKTKQISPNSHESDKPARFHSNNQEAELPTNSLEDIPSETHIETRNESSKDADLNAEKKAALEEDLEEMRLNLRNQQEVTEQVRQEAAQFLQEMRALTRRHEEQISKAAALDSEKKHWQARFEKTSKELDRARNSRIETAISLPDLAEPLPEMYISPSGKLSESQLRACMNSVTVLAAAVQGHERSDTLLDLLHRVVLSARDISSSDQLIVRGVKQLISAVRNYAVSSGLYPRILVTAACSDLSIAVVEYTKEAKVIKAEATENQISSVRITSERGTQPSEQPAPRSTPLKAVEVNTPKETEATTEKLQLPTNTLAQTPDADAKSVVEEPIEEPSEQLTEQPGSVERAEKEAAGSPANSRQLHRPKQGPELPLDESILNLRSYLEDRTNGTVETIGAILASIKSNETVGTLKPLIAKINELVGDMILTTEKTMTKTRSDVLKKRGSFIVQNLKDCLARMVMLRDEELEAIRDDAKPNRHLKQRLAGVNFDMAKSTKELVKTIEECVLQDELDHIDRKLE